MASTAAARGISVAAPDPIRRLWTLLTVAMVAALVAVLLEALLGLGSWGRATVARFADDVVVFAAAMLCLLRGREELSRRAAWFLLAGALGAWGLGSAYQSVVLWGRDDPQASPADVVWLALYPLTGLAFLGFARAQLGRLDLRLGVDVLIGALALMALIAGELLASVGSSHDPLAAAAGVAYAVGDLVLVALAVALGNAHRWELDRLWAVLLAGFLFTVAGDLLYARDLALGHLDNSSVVAAAWSCGAALIGLSTRVASPPPRGRRRDAGAIGLPIVLAFGALAIVVFSSVAPVEPASVLLAAGSLGACLFRLALTHHDNVVLLDEADAHAHVDALTGLGNRRAFVRDAERMAASLGEDMRLRLSLFDLDGFKGYNDRHGHLAGDELLGRLSRRMRAAVAGAGCCYRLGGDEFCLLMVVAEDEPDRISARAAAALSETGSVPRVSCSYGSTTMRADTPLGESLRMADERMYAHKRARRRPAQSDDPPHIPAHVLPRVDAGTAAQRLVPRQVLGS